MERFILSGSGRGGVNVGIGFIDFHIDSTCFGRRRIVCGMFQQRVVPAVFEFDWAGVVQSRVHAFTDEASVPKCYCRIDARIDGVVWEAIPSTLPDELSKSLEASVQEMRPNADAIKAAAMRNKPVPGTEVRRGSHLRVA